MRRDMAEWHYSASCCDCNGCLVNGSCKLLTQRAKLQWRQSFHLAELRFANMTTYVTIALGGGTGMAASVALWNFGFGFIYGTMEMRQMKSLV